MTWQSQPRQSLKDKQIRQLINHDELKNNIYLFLRTNRDRDYTYLGKLKYLSHDREREFPVHFQWQILDWEPGNTAERMSLRFQNARKDIGITNQQSKDLLEMVQPPPQLRRSGISTPTFKSKKNADYSEKESRNRELGLLGEELVIMVEKEKLIKHGKAKLAEKIRHVSKILGDGAGYDIESYTLEGDSKYIEVKTTKGGKTASFFMSSNEKAFADMNKDKYYLYRIFDYDKETNTGKYFILQGALDAKLDFSPTQFRVSFSRDPG